MNKSLFSLVAVVATLASASACAQGYVGAGVGPSKINVDCTGTITCDKTDTGYKLYGGFRFPNQLAVEGVYFDWGKATGTGTIEGLGTGSGEVKASGFGIGVAYFVPFATNWTGVGRLGVAQTKGKTTLTGEGTISDSFTGTFPYYGLGIAYNFTPNLAVTGEADFSRVKYTDADKANVQLLSVGIRYSF